MSIHKIGSDLIRPAGTRDPIRGSGSSKGKDSEEPHRVERIDRVEISAEGLELAARLVDEGEALSESRVALIQERIARGHYDEPAVAGRVAERLIASGDLDTH